MRTLTVHIIMMFLTVNLFAQGAHGMLSDRTRFLGGGGVPTTITIKINDGDDDCEQDSPDGSTSFTSSDLEKTYDGNEQIIGLRFNGITVPQGATITEAFVQFTSRFNDTNACTLRVVMEFADNAAPMTSGNAPSDRTWTTAFTDWIPPSWTGGSDQKDDDTKTPNFASVMQTVVNRSNWASGNSMCVFVIAEPFNSGVNQRRNSRSFNTSGGSKAPELIITYLQ